jgi:hypothetical protein
MKATPKSAEPLASGVDRLPRAWTPTQPVPQTSSAGTHCKRTSEDPDDTSSGQRTSEDPDDMSSGQRTSEDSDNTSCGKRTSKDRTTRHLVNGLQTTRTTRHLVNGLRTTRTTRQPANGLRKTWMTRRPSNGLRKIRTTRSPTVRPLVDLSWTGIRSPCATSARRWRQRRNLRNSLRGGRLAVFRLDSHATRSADYVCGHSLQTDFGRFGQHVIRQTGSGRPGQHVIRPTDSAHPVGLAQSPTRQK